MILVAAEKRGGTSYASSDLGEEELRDPACDPDNPVTIRFEDISAAAYRIKDGIVSTPCDPSHMNQDLNMEVSHHTQRESHSNRKGLFENLTTLYCRCT